jgi:outer membrane lipoprotein LolB
MRVLIAATALSLMLAGCSLLPSRLDAPLATGLAEYVEHFDLTGRISVRNNERGEFGNLRWIRTAQDEYITLFSPLGQTLAEISRAQGQEAVLRSGNEIRRAASLEILVREILGAEVPIADLAFWIQGKSTLQAEIAARDSSGRPERLSYADWQVSIEDYRGIGAAVVAGRISAVKGDTKVKVIIDEWKALP